MPKIITLDGLDDAIIGIAERCAEPPRLVYDRDLIIMILMKDDMDEEDAVDYFYFNILGLWAGDTTPMILTRASPKEAIDWAIEYNEGEDE